jgi:hypothetical protein
VNAHSTIRPAMNWTAYRRLQGRVQAIVDEAQRCRVDVRQIAQASDHATFPEQRMEDLATELETEARNIRICIAEFQRERAA